MDPESSRPPGSVVTRPARPPHGSRVVAEQLAAEVLADRRGLVDDVGQDLVDVVVEVGAAALDPGVEDAQPLEGLAAGSIVGRRSRQGVARS